MSRGWCPFPCLLLESPLTSLPLSLLRPLLRLRPLLKLLEPCRARRQHKRRVGQLVENRNCLCRILAALE